MQQINANMYKAMILSAAANLSNHKSEVDNMNVFPVPDGDTGTNMSMTMDACEAAILTATDKENVSALTKIVANSALRGARGNSGVILSQLMRGIHKAVSSYDDIDCKALADAFQSASNSAYKAVMKPTEGTILTVARKMGEFASKKQENYDNVVVFLNDIVEAGKIALGKTPDMLPQLKQAGVVDSGGQGLIYLCEGALYALKNGEPIIREEASVIKTPVSGAAGVEIDNLKFKYCTECIIEKSSQKCDAFKLKLILESKGDSMVVVDDEDIIKIHIHTNQPDFVLGEALKYGELSSIKIENMKLQHSNLSEKSNDSEDVISSANESEMSEPKEYGFVSVAVGSGLVDTFKSLGVDIVIEGGQTMNPSTDDILSAIEKINAKNIFVYPNNKNIIMAAEQAKQLSDKNVYVIPTKSIVQAMSSLLAFDEDKQPDDNYSEMVEVLSEVKSAQVTYAVRDTVVNDKPISPGDILGILENKITNVDTDINESVFNLLDNMVDEDSSVITLFYGDEINEEDAGLLKDKIESMYDECDVYMHFGGQPVYYYFISVE